jgi:hypothetical protein
LKLSAVLLARAIALFDVADLSPSGRVFFPALVPLIVERFSFQQFPNKPEDFDVSNGTSFKTGFIDGLAVEELTLYNDGIKLDLASSTADSKRILLDSLRWLSTVTNVVYRDDMIQRWAWLSQLTFYSGINLDGVSRAFEVLGSRLTVSISSRLGMPCEFRASGLSFNFERVAGNIPISSFLIERRAKTAFSESKYYSQAPLETDQHIEFLQEFEQNLLETVK